MTTLKEKINSHRIDAKDAQSATKIINSLNKLKETNDENTSYRWIWELIQNAKDVTNSTGKVDILIKFSENDKVVEFSHNGKLFSTQNIVFLIEQVSTKDQEKEINSSKKATGRFGTGFLTTHLLSEKVQVHGYVQDSSDEIPQSFKTLLDRTGKYNSAIIEAIQNSCKMLEVSKEQEVDELNFNTKFIYELDEKGINTAKKGLENLLISAPYVFAFVPEVNSIALYSDNYYRKICREDRIPNKPEGASITKVSISKTNKNGETDIQTKYIFALSNDSVSIAVETTANDRDIHILKPSNKLPRIFCDFPLLGTEDFAFPVVINSSSFNPTDPRDGIPLEGTERADENKIIIGDVVGLFNTMLNYFVSNGYKNLYHVVKVPEQVVKEWLDDKWIEDNLLSPVKEHIKTINLINNSLGELSCLYDVWEAPNIFIMKDETPELRKKVWELSNRLIPTMMTQKDEIEHWYNSLWVECHNFGIIDLIKEVEKCGDLTSLSNRLGCDSIKWLNELISLLYSNSNKFIAELERNPSILPNQYGDFLPLDKLYAENNIGEIYKNLAIIAEIDFREKLLDNRVARDHLQGLQELNLKDVFRELIYAKIDEETKIEFYKYIINLRGGINERQSEFIEIAKHLYPDCFNEDYKVTYSNEKLLSDALKFWREKTCMDFSFCNSISGVIEQYNFQNDREVVEWISKLANHFTICDDNNLLDKYAILPNQCGIFMRKSEIFLDDDSVNEILKDASMYSGNDVRQKMLFKGILLDLPPNRIISLEHVAPEIIAFVRNNNKSLSKQNFEVRETFRNTSIWLRNNRSDSKVSKCFKELIENFHWFYDDEEIAESMAKSEQYDEVLKKYNVANINVLANILASHSMANETEAETISISRELLAQWGITSEEELQKALSKNVFGSAQIHRSTNSVELFDYVNSIINRAKNNIINYLYEHDDYTFDKENLQFIGNTIFRVRKLGHDIYIIARPSDFEQVILYYDTEIDLLDFDKDCELWVENEIDPIPKKITLGRILKLTGVNKIPLRSLMNDD